MTAGGTAAEDLDPKELNVRRHFGGKKHRTQRDRGKHEAR